jgi:ribosomal subunit interface protein
LKPENGSSTILVQSASIHLGERLPAYARESIEKIAAKYFGRLNGASAYFSKEGITYRCSVNVQMGGLSTKSAEASDKDIYAAFDAALAKVAKQLRRTKRQLREDQPVRTDKDVVIRSGLGLPPQS